jgi:uncharacterized membrane protein SpoIIM required for sporulation
MVLESLINPLEAGRRPQFMALLGFVYATVGLLLGLWIFPDNPSLTIVFLTTMAGIPLIVNSLKKEAEEEIRSKDKAWLVGEHKDILGIFFFLFIGMLLAYVTWYVMLPQELVDSVFYEQISTIRAINTNVAGRAVGPAAPDLIRIIMLNNFKVMAFCLLFSLIYGSGAIFILTWNASVLGTAIGNYIKVNLSIAAVPLGFGRYMLHGIPEILAYFLAGIAGGIISAGIIRRKKSKKFKEVMLDSLDLIILASVPIIIGGIIEVYISLGM